MRKGSGASLDLGRLPAGQKGWNSERVRTLSNNVGGRTLGSKWEDAERWICSPNLGLGNERNKDMDSQGGQKRRPKSKSGPIVPPVALYYSNNSPTYPGLEGGSLRNFVTSSPFSTGVLAADSVCLNYGGMGRSASLLGMPEFLGDDEKFDDNSSEELMVARAVSQRDMGTQISQNTKSSPTRRRSSFAPSSPTLVSIVEQQREHLARLEVREVQVDNPVTVAKEPSGGAESTLRSPPNVSDFSNIAFQDQTPSLNIAEAAMNTSRLQREEAKISAWENLQKAKAEAALRKLEMKLEKKKASTMDKIMKKLSRAQVKANKMRSSMAVGDSHQLPQTPIKAHSSSKHVRMGSLRWCFTCNAS